MRFKSCYDKCIRRKDVMVRVSASQSVDMGFIPLVELYQKTLKNDFHSFPSWRLGFRECCGEQPASSLVVFLVKALGGTPPPLCGRQVAHIPWK